MTQNSLARKLEYSCTLFEAGIAGLRNARSGSARFAPDLVDAAGGALQTAFIGTGVVLLGATFGRHRSGIARTALACATATFCADFLWRTRVLNANMVTAARRELSKARDRHWLELNPVDYA